MSQHKHTPGPWAVGFADGSGRGTEPKLGAWIVRSGFGIYDPRCTTVVWGGDDEGLPIGVVGNSVEERQANAALIASAPDLLTVLEEIAGGINVPGMADMVLAGNWHGVVDAMQAKARGAVAKAMGA